MAEALGVGAEGGRGVLAVQGTQEVIRRSILCYLSNGEMSLKARVSVAKSRREGSICVS